MPQFGVELTTVSWIDRKLMSIYSGFPYPWDGWVKMLAYGMCHTGNPTPPASVRGDDGRNALGKQYRSFMDCALELDIGTDGAFRAVRQKPQSAKISDPGFTPPFDSTFEKVMGAAGLALAVPSAVGPMWSEAGRYSPGEKSSLSQIFLPDTAWQSQGVPQIPYSSISVKQGEIILAHALIKFRAGAQGDYLGIMAMGCPNHLPWVWCEAILTYQNKFNVVLYGAGSAFPCHAFYLNGKQKDRLDLANKPGDLEKIFTRGLKAEVIYAPVFDPQGAGASAPIGINAQIPMAESFKPGQPLPDQPYTAPANDRQFRIETPLTSLGA